MKTGQGGQVFCKKIPEILGDYVLLHYMLEWGKDVLYTMN